MPFGLFVADIEGNLIEGIEEDVPSIEPNVTLKEALRIAASHEEDDIDDILFISEEDGQLVMYVPV